MKMRSQMMGGVCVEKFNGTGTAKGGCPKQCTGRISASVKPVSRPSETMSDLQSYGLMEERYGIQEEGLF